MLDVSFFIWQLQYTLDILLIWYIFDHQVRHAHHVLLNVFVFYHPLIIYTLNKIWTAMEGIILNYVGLPYVYSKEKRLNWTKLTILN